MKKLTLLILAGLLCVTMASCDSNEEKEIKEDKEIVTVSSSVAEKAENNLYDPALIGTWILQEESEDGEQKPVQCMHFFENGECYYHYYETLCYYSIKEFTYYALKRAVITWYTEKSASLMILDSRIFKYAVKDNILTIIDDYGESQMFIKSNENVVDIITKNRKCADESYDNAENAYREYEESYEYDY